MRWRRTSDSHRCDVCRNQANRCEPCRAARAAVKRDLLERKRQSGICIQCSEPALADMTLCAHHNEMNNRISRASHERRRQSA